MNNEIKEILDYLKEFIDEDRLEQINLNRWFISSLLDYITNLQEQLHQASLDIQELTERDIECPSWCDKLTKLQQENQDLSRMCELYGKSLYNAELTDYKSRIDKAIEYVKECYTQPPNIENFMHEGEMNYLLNILRGEDK
jgi:hypothetical protein